MENNYKEISKLKADLSDALITRIENSEKISSLSLEQLSADINADVDIVCSVVNDITELPLYWFEQQLTIIFMRLVVDFSDDKDASTREKLLETLMSIFETFGNKRHIVRYIYQWGLKDINLSILLGTFLYNICDRILGISGDKKQDMFVSSIFRSVRVKGLMALLIKIFLVWMKDDSEDLSLTYREIDQSLNRASEWAKSFKLI